MTRKPTVHEFQRMQGILELVTAYEMGAEDRDFTLFERLSRERIKDDDSLQLLRNAVQFAWLMLRNIDAHASVSKEETLRWYGQRFAQRAEGLED